MVISKKLILLLTLSLFLVSCGGFYMIEQETKPEIKPKSDKATIVVYRHVSFGGMVVFSTYIDNKLAGQTKMKSYFIAEVDPGEHYIVTSAENNSCAKINTEAGKVYYLNVIPHMGVMKARVGTSASDPETFEEQKPEMDYYQLSTTDLSPDDLKMEDDEYKETIADYEKELVEDPERHKDMVNIKGY